MAVVEEDDTPQVRNIDLFDVWLSEKTDSKHKAVLEHLKHLLGYAECTEEETMNLDKIVRIFCLKINNKWQKSSRNHAYFLKSNKKWLEMNVPLQGESEQHVLEATPGTSKGRPRKLFEESSQRTKRRRVQELLKTKSPEELKYAADVASSSAEKGQADSRCLSPQQALALYLDLNLSHSKYSILRSVVNGLHSDCFPSLYTLKQTKKMLLPRNIETNETMAKVDLQEVLDITVRSIAKLIDLGDSKLLTLICKWGFDGSSGHSVYKQKFADDSVENTDEFMFLIAFSPLKLIDRESGLELWSNPRPSSTFFCRPIKFIFSKENSTLIRDEENEMSNLINNLGQCQLNINNDVPVMVNYEMLLTMVDGSVCNVLSNTNSTQTCYICGATPKEMNREDIENKPANIENYRFGLSSLHSWIRCFECLLHIAYRLPFKTWQVRSNEHKAIFEERKKHIQSEFKKRMGLIVDKPKQGYGSSNDGNTARRFFGNPQLSSEITGIDVELIKLFSLILRILASGKKIDVIKISDLLALTKKKYIDLYGWYYMPSSVHKLLMHGSEVIASFELPIGQLSEEALEARHKEVRNLRLLHTRKSSRLNTNEDLMRALLITSDPLISSCRKNISRKVIRVDNEVQKYLIDSSLDLSYNVDLPGDLELSDDEGTTSDSESD